MNTISAIKKYHNRVFAIQLMECALVLVLYHLSLLFAGKLIYYDPFPFGISDGFLMNSMLSAFAVIILRTYKYFSFISKPLLEAAIRVIVTVIILDFMFIALLFLRKGIFLSLYYYIVANAFQVMCLIFVKRFSGSLKAEIMKKMTSLVIGKSRQKNELMDALRKQSIGRLNFVSPNELDLLERVDTADFIYLSGSLSKKFKDQIISYCVLKNKRIYIVPETYEIAVRRAEMSQIGDIPVFDIESFQLSEAQKMVKRIIDIILSLIGIICAASIMLYAMIRIKLEDGGPIFYKQVRSGLNGREYEVIKFRSMIVDAEKYTGAVFAAENDPRITKIGRLMRATRIDEIPQFFNVIAGSMSMIGPRPERPVFVETFGKEIPEYINRLAVKPGITGLAQVMGNYTTSPENKAKFDLVYIRDYSLLLDLKILFKTVKVVLTKEQAAGFSEQESDFDFSAEIDAEGALSMKQRSVHKKYNSLKRLILVSLCFFLIISGSLFLRYSAVAITMMEASVQPVLEERKILTDETSAELTERIYEDAVSLDAGKPAARLETGTDSAESVVSGYDSEESSNSQTDQKTGNSGIHDSSENQVVLSQERINTALESITLKEKAEIAYKLVAKMDSSDLMSLEKLAEGGFTSDEKIKAKEMMYQYFDDSEVDYIKKIYWEHVE